MNLAISNLAWDLSEDNIVLPIINKYGIKSIELAPSKIWTNPTEVSESKLIEYKKYWNKNGVEIVATTSLLFGHPELKIFENKNIRDKTLDYLIEMIRVSAALGAKAMVFGSPKNRIKGQLPSNNALDIAVEFFGKLGEIAKEYSIYFGIEANPAIYGTDFINSTPEAISLIKKVGHPNFGLHLDTSTMTINHEDYEATIKSGLKYNHHFHISEPGLKPIPSGETDHKKVENALSNLNYSNCISIEMPLNEPSGRFSQIEKTLNFVCETYR